MRFWCSTQLKLETDHLYNFLSPGFLALWEASAADLGGDLYVFSQTAHQQTLSQEFQVICSWIQIAVQVYGIKWGAWLMSVHQCNKIIVQAELKILWCIFLDNTNKSNILLILNFCFLRLNSSDDDGEPLYIQMVTALVLQLIQCVVHLPNDKDMFDECDKVRVSLHLQASKYNIYTDLKSYSDLLTSSFSNCF